MVEVLKVSSKSNPSSVAGALANISRNAGEVEVQVVGAGALNQAIKAIAIARGYVATSGLDLTCRPTFADIEIDGESRTAIRLLVETGKARRMVPDEEAGGAGGPSPTASGAPAEGLSPGAALPPATDPAASGAPAEGLSPGAALPPATDPAASGLSAPSG